MSVEDQSRIRAEVRRITYRNEENGWTVAQVRQENHSVDAPITGSFPLIQEGETYELIGSWVANPKYGRQFKVERCVAVRPESKEAITRYLASGLIKGIGPKTAAKIVKHFGSQTLDVLDENPRRLFEVPTIGKKKGSSIIASWNDQRAAAGVTMFLSAHGITSSHAAKIFKAYGQKAVDIVSSDPYRLATDIHGIGFLSADRIAQSVGIAVDSKERLRAAIVYQLGQAEDQGHCYITTKQLLGQLVDNLGLTSEQVLQHFAGCLTELNEAGQILSERLSEEHTTTAHYQMDLAAAEWTLATKLSKWINEPLVIDQDRTEKWLLRYSKASGTELAEEQREAVLKAASARIFILTGGPGVGKTTTANAIIRLLKAMGKEVALAAPTGRAAQRLAEVAATNAKTIHRLLEWNPQLGGFSRDETNPLAAQAVIVDEASMLDIRLAAALIQAVPTTSQLILIGDIDQLPSVGPGNVLRDLIDSKQVPFTRLGRIFRQAASSSIVQTAHSINRGVSPQFPPLASGSDCIFIAQESGAEIIATIRGLLKNQLPDEFGFDPIRDVQILTPMNRGELGTHALNDDLQNLLNPPSPTKTELKRGNLLMRAGDKVIQSSNNYDLGVFNGDIGHVLEAGTTGGEVIVRFTDGRTVTFKKDHVSDLRLAYAITIHKSQGSEFPVVILPTSMQHYVMLQRNLIYTGLTRAKKLAIFIGSKKALNHAINNQKSLKRQTTLVERLTQVTSG